MSQHFIRFRVPLKRLYIHIYIYIERERERSSFHTHTYRVCVCVYIYIYGTKLFGEFSNGSCVGKIMKGKTTKDSCSCYE